MEPHARLLIFSLGFVALSCCISATNEAKVQREQPLPLEYEDLGVPGGEEENQDPDDIHVYQGVRGRAGIDFPVLKKIPKTSFSCRKMKTSGYFADLDTGCQVFHLCEGGRKMSFLCPNGTIFRQSKLTCDWWFKVDCPSSEEFYESSAEQLRHDRANTFSATTTPGYEQGDRVSSTSSKERSDSRESRTTRRQSSERVTTTPVYDVTDESTSRVNTHVSQHLNKDEALSRRYYEESQEVAETGSFIIPRHRQEISSTIKTYNNQQRSRPVYGTKQSGEQSTYSTVYYNPTESQTNPSAIHLSGESIQHSTQQTTTKSSQTSQESQSHSVQTSESYSSQQSHIYSTEQSQTIPTPKESNQEPQIYPTQNYQTYPTQQSQIYSTEQSQTNPTPKESNQQPQIYPTQNYPTQQSQTISTQNQQIETFPTQNYQTYSTQQSQTNPSELNSYPTQNYQENPNEPNKQFQSQPIPTQQSQTFPTQNYQTYPTQQSEAIQGTSAFSTRQNFNGQESYSTSTDIPSTTQEPVTETYVIPEKRLELPTTTPRKSETNTFAPEVTTEQAAETTRFPFESSTASWDDTTQGIDETLQGSHSQWYTGTTTNVAFTTQEDLNQVSFFTAPDTTLLPPNEEPVRPLAGTERAARGFTANPRPRPGLTQVPLSASPETLHSLARYFAADNVTRHEIEKEVPPATMKFMESMMPEMEKVETAQKKDKLSPDLRQLAQIFSKALADYLEDPEGFRQTLSSVRPTDPPPVHNFVDEEKDEVLDYSDTVNTKRPKTTTETPVETTTFATTEYPVKNEVASIVNEVLQEPTARKVPDNLLIHEETQYRFNTPRDINSLNYLLSESLVTTTESTIIDTTTTPYPINPEKIPENPSDKFAYSVPEYVEINYQKTRQQEQQQFVPSNTGNNYFEPETINEKSNRNLDQPSLEAVLQHFAPHDLNSLAVFSVETNPSPVQVSIHHSHNPSPTPVSVAVHFPQQSNNNNNIHRVTVVTSSHSGNINKGTTYRPMISKLLFPLPTVDQSENKTFEYTETLQSANTASFPPSFRNAQSIIQASKDRILKSWINEDKSVSQLLTETIPTTPATTNEPVTEEIPTTVRILRPVTTDYPEHHYEDLEIKTGVEYAPTSESTVTTVRNTYLPKAPTSPSFTQVSETEVVPTGRRVSESGGQQLVLLLVKNGVPTQETTDINNSKLLQALIKAGKNTTETTEEPFTSTTDVITTTTEDETSVTVTSLPSSATPNKKQPIEVTTYRSAQHNKILERVRESTEVQDTESPIRAEPLIQEPEDLGNSTHPDSRALNILKSLYSLASRWG